MNELIIRNEDDERIAEIAAFIADGLGSKFGTQAALSEVNQSLSHVLERLSTIETSVVKHGDDELSGRFEKKTINGHLLDDTGTVHHDLLDEIKRVHVELDKHDDKFNEEIEEEIIIAITEQSELRDDFSRETLERILKLSNSMLNRMRP